MTLTFGITLWMLFAGVLHATWNALVKGRGSDPMVDTALVMAGGAVISVAFLPFVPAPPPDLWGYMAVSTVVHMGYYVSLVRAYQHADLSFAYPLMRGTAPLLVTLAGVFWFGEHPSPSMWMGILLISGGIVSIAFLTGKGRPTRQALLWPLGTALTIAVYTLVDGAGARAAPTALTYVMWLSALECLPFLAFVAWRRRRRLATDLRLGWRRGMIGGACSLGSYGIALWAMTRAPVGAVSALRETSVLFAAVIGSLLLREGFGRARMVGAGLVVAGIAVLKS